jgi:hypothetical protein
MKLNSIKGEGSDDDKRTDFLATGRMTLDVPLDNDLNDRTANLEGKELLETHSNGVAE